MAFTIVAMTSAANSGAPVITVDCPPGVQAGDLLVACYRSQDQTSVADPQMAGFALAPPAPTAPNRPGRIMAIFTKIATASEPATYTAQSLEASGNRSRIVLMALRGHRTSSPVVATADTYPGITTSSSITTSPHAGALELFMAGAECGAGVAHVPAAAPPGFTQRAAFPAAEDPTTASRTALWVGTRTVGEGTVTPESITWAAGVTGQSALSVLIAPAGAADRLDTPVVVLGATTHPSTPGASNGAQVVTWDPVAGAVRYSAHRAAGATPAQNEFVQVAANVAPPYTFTGLAEGRYALGIRAEVT